MSARFGCRDRRMFDTNRPRVAVLEGMDIDPLPVRRLRSVLLTLQPAFGNPSRLRLDLGGKRHEIERRLMRHQLVHPLAHQSPVLFRNGERAAKVQQCLRTDLVPLPPARDQTVGHMNAEPSLAVLVRVRTINMTQRVSRKAAVIKPRNIFFGTTSENRHPRNPQPIDFNK